MIDHYDITREPWLPVIMLNGEVKQVGLRELFTQAHEIRDLVTHDRIERLAILYCLIAINMRAFPDWEQTWERGYFDSDVINEYFDRYENKFDLLGDTPFYQVKNLEEKVGNERRAVPLNQLPLVKHVTTQVLDPTASLSLAETVPLLMTAFVYCQPGRIASTTLAGKSSFAWGSTGFVAMGDNVFSAIMLNTVNPTWGDYDWEKDLAWWERDEDTYYEYEKTSEERIPDGVADFLTYMHRRFELVLDAGSRVIGFKAWGGRFWKPETNEHVMGIDPFSIYLLKTEKQGGETVEKYVRQKFQTRSMLTTNDKKKAYVPRGILGGLFYLYQPESTTSSLVNQRVDELESHFERFTGFEIARLIVDASMGTLVEDYVEEGLNVPYSLESNPELASKAYAVMVGVYSLQNDFEYALKTLLPLGMLETSNSTMSHYLDLKMRDYLQGGAQQNSQEFLREVAMYMKKELDYWVRNIPVKSWQKNHKALWNFNKNANGHIRAKEVDE